MFGITTDGKKSLRDIAKMYADYEAELRMSSRDENAIKECKEKFIKAHANQIFSKLGDEGKYKKSTTVKHLLSDIDRNANPETKETKEERDSLLLGMDEKSEEPKKVKGPKEVKDSREAYLKTLIPEDNNNSAKAVYKFQRWVYRNAKAHGYEYLGDKGSPLEYLEKNFFNKEMDVQLRALFYLEKNYRKEAQEDRIHEVRESEFASYTPDVKKLRGAMVGTVAKVWKLFDGSRYYWDKLKDCIDKAVADDKELHPNKYKKKETEKKSEKGKNNILDNIIQTDELNQDIVDLGTMKENEEDLHDNDINKDLHDNDIKTNLLDNDIKKTQIIDDNEDIILDGKKIIEIPPVPGLVMPEKKPQKHGAWKTANHGFKSVESYIYNTEKKLTDWNYTYGQVEKLPDNFVKIIHEDEKASHKFTKKSAELIFGSGAVKKQDETLKSVPATYDKYDGITDMAFNALGFVNQGINAWDNFSDMGKNRQTVEKAEKFFNGIEAVTRAANAGVSVASGYFEKFSSKEPVKITKNLYSWTNNTCVKYIEEKGLAAVGKFGGFIADGFKLISGAISHIKTWRRRNKLESAEKTVGNNKEQDRKVKRRIGLLKYLNKLNYFNSVPKVLTAACGIAAGITTMFIAAPIFAAGFTLAGALIGLFSSKVLAEFPNRRKKRAAIDSELLVDDDNTMESRKDALRDRIRANYGSADACVQKRMQKKLSIKGEKNAETVKSDSRHHHLGNILRREAIAEKGYLNMNAAYSGLLKDIAKESVEELNKDKDNKVYRAILNAGGVSTKKIRKPKAPKKGTLIEKDAEALKKQESKTLDKRIDEAKEIMAKL